VLNFSLVPRFTDATESSRKEWKQILSLSTRFTIWGWWYANATVFFFPSGGQQQQWDPDFTCGFGYFDWHPGSFSLQYDNYSGNRFPWRHRGKDTGRFENGSVTFSWSWAW